MKKEIVLKKVLLIFYDCLKSNIWFLGQELYPVDTYTQLTDSLADRQKSKKKKKAFKVLGVAPLKIYLHLVLKVSSIEFFNLTEISICCCFHQLYSSIL